MHIHTFVNTSARPNLCFTNIHTRNNIWCESGRLTTTIIRQGRFLLNSRRLPSKVTHFSSSDTFNGWWIGFFSSMFFPFWSWNGCCQKMYLIDSYFSASTKLIKGQLLTDLSWTVCGGWKSYIFCFSFKHYSICYHVLDLWTVMP